MPDLTPSIGRRILLRSFVALSVLSVLILGSVGAWLKYQSKRKSDFGHFYNEQLQEKWREQQTEESKARRAKGFTTLFDENWFKETQHSRDRLYDESRAYGDSGNLILWLSGIVPVSLWILWLILMWVIYGRITAHRPPQSA